MNTFEVKIARYSISLTLVILLLGTSFLYAQEAEFEKPGVVDGLPAFYKKLTLRMNYPLSWLHGGHGNFATWRIKARKKVMESLLAAPPPVPFAAKVIAEQDRGSYIARKIVFNVTGNSRVLALMLVPKSPGPHPSVLLLHDHGAQFDIGKEKVIAPFDEPAAKMESAQKWTENYGGDSSVTNSQNEVTCVCQ